MKKKGTLYAVSERLPFRIKAWNCNYWATWGVLDLVGRNSGSYMHMQCSCY